MWYHYVILWKRPTFVIISRVNYFQPKSYSQWNRVKWGISKWGLYCDGHVHEWSKIIFVYSVLVTDLFWDILTLLNSHKWQWNGDFLFAQITLRLSITLRHLESQVDCIMQINGDSELESSKTSISLLWSCSVICSNKELDLSLWWMSMAITVLHSYLCQGHYDVVWPFCCEHNL